MSELFFHRYLGSKCKLNLFNILKGRIVLNSTFFIFSEFLSFHSMREPQKNPQANQL